MSELDLLRGGRTSWKIANLSLDTDVLQLVSVEGLTIGTGFEPSHTSATVTVTFIDPTHGLAAPKADVVGSTFLIYCDETPVWGGRCTTVDTVHDQLSVTLVGELSFIQQDTLNYTVTASTPADGYKEWLTKSLLPTYPGEVLPPHAYTDSYYRNYAQVIPAASTLGEWLPPLAYSKPRVTAYEAEPDSGGVYRKVAYGPYTLDVDPFVTLESFGPCPEATRKSSMISKHPLDWHLTGSMYYNASFGVTENPGYNTQTRPGRCSWMLGRDQYISVTGLKLTNAGGNPVKVVNGGLQPNDTTTKRVRTTNLSNLLREGVGWGGFLGNPTVFAHWGQYFKTINQGVYEATQRRDAAAICTSWSAGHPSWLDSDKIADEQTFSDALVGRAEESTKNTDYGATAGFKYVHPDTRSTTDFAQLQAHNMAVEYSVQQIITPITIQQEAWSSTSADEASFLAGVTYTEGYTRWRDRQGLHISYTTLCDLYPESGALYTIPLCADTISDLQWQRDNAIPKTFHLKWKDSLNNEHEGTYTNPASSVGEFELSILQGSVMAGDQAALSSGTLMERDSNRWDRGAAMPLDRYSGVYYDGSTLRLRSTVGTATDAFSVYGFGYLDTNGRVYAALRSPANMSNQFGAYADYSVQDANGVASCLFGHHLSLAPSYGTGWDDTTSKVDIMPLLSLIRASARVYDMASRPTYTCTATANFATVPIGTVCYMRLPSFDSGKPWLAIILSKTLSTSAGVQLVIAPMHAVRDSDYTAWTNLSNIVAHYHF